MGSNREKSNIVKHFDSAQTIISHFSNNILAKGNTVEA